MAKKNNNNNNLKNRKKNTVEESEENINVIQKEEEKPKKEEKTVLLAEQPKSQKWINWRIRTIWTFVMIFAFFFIIFSGHLCIILLVLVLQILIFKEIIAIAHYPSQEKKLPWFRIINWYFLFVGIYYLYGEGIMDYFKFKFMKYELFQILLNNHKFITFCLYTFGFVIFIMSLRKGFYQFQFIQFAWTHLILLFVVFQAHFLINNILQGIIWFFLPVSQIIVNDIAAYVCGFFWGRTPLIQLSPKKTWEGFIGAFFLTGIWGIFFSLLLAQFSYFTCPATNLHTNVLSHVTCEPHPVFIPTAYNIPTIIVDVFSIFGIKLSTVTIIPIVLHSIVLSAFASIIAPFGGFFASGLKRAFKIKDFGDTIPGHGGVTDRFDCQLLMAAFSSLYYMTFIKTPETTVSFLMNQIITLDAEQRLELYNKFKDFMVDNNLLK
ncbi:phosphatidate cytidylyltransferase [Neocallimastix lanati (nom. inval.)]|jgi:phosphatidate cytidylyltransferase|uniref:Phosphatidate cytidylyltransferase n=1 Tax=Neocallimastix californiae TaxID=1754190 RepID=A0A1Y2CLS3_9FUNG|nr:phosphatidate cytidylyltransferase [Neocallimastix sp. JGI-2020a]ORY47962.1 phosphatidate cytidylyltransferase [Neocallimastix californiae]|eukprot:ORY47962.1 phosphatidate cytidylyltransferase [Neocallimastix californiae]